MPSRAKLMPTAQGRLPLRLDQRRFSSGLSAAAVATACVLLLACAEETVAPRLDDRFRSYATVPVGSVEQTPTGFYYPTGTGQLGPYAGWLDEGCKKIDTPNTNYYKNLYHIGRDIQANVGDPVYAIMNGTVVNVSRNGWDAPGDPKPKKIALVIEHQLADGTKFIAIYGHMHSQLLAGSEVLGGDVIGTIGHWDGAPHLHFGVRPGTSLQGPYGRMKCQSWPDANGFVDPIDWILTRIPPQLGIVMTPRAWASAGTLGTEIIVIGGGICVPNATSCAGFGQDETPIVESLITTTDSWIARGPVNVPRWSAGAAAVNGRVFVFGGTGGCCSQPIAQVEEYDPNTGLWTIRPTSMGIPRWKPATAAFGGRIYSFGGGTTGNQTQASNAVEAFDPAADSWTPRQPMPTSRYGAAAAQLNGIIYVIGGVIGSSGQTALVEAYLPNLDSWLAQPPAPMNVARWDLAGGVLDGKIYALGGVSIVSGTLVVRSDLETYDPATNTWTTHQPMPTPRTGVVAAVINGKLYAVGGFNGTAVVNTVEVFDPLTNSWSTL